MNIGDKDIEEIKKLQEDLPFLKNIEPITPNDPIGKAFSEAADHESFIRQLEYYIHGRIEDGEKHHEVKKAISEYVDDILKHITTKDKR